MAKPPARTPRIIRTAEVLTKVGVSGTTLWRMRLRGEFPDPFFISRGLVGWLETDVDTWIDDRRRGSQPGDQV